MRIVALADTHLFTEDLVVPDGDLLIHAGDLLRGGELDELQVGVEWLAALPHRHTVFVAGNHDRCFEDRADEARALLPDGWIYLEDEGVEIEGLRIWGSPWQPEFLGWAFNLPRGEALAEKWAQIPDDTDILITHGPPHGYGDRAWGEHLGCRELTKALDRVQPTLHCFGHIHEDRGVWQDGDITIANVTTNEGDEPPTVFDLVDARLVRVALVMLVTVFAAHSPSQLFAQDTDTTDTTTTTKDDPDAGANAEKPRIVIEGLWDEGPANLRAPAWERTEQPDPLVRDASWVREMLDRSDILLRGLQRPAQIVHDLEDVFRAAVRTQWAAYQALRADELPTAAFLTMRMRAMVREGFEEENVTLADDFEDTDAEKRYAAQATAKDAAPFLKAALDRWGHFDTDPHRSPHHFRFRLLPTPLAP